MLVRACCCNIAPFWVQRPCAPAGLPMLSLSKEIEPSQRAFRKLGGDKAKETLLRMLPMLMAPQPLLHAALNTDTAKAREGRGDVTRNWKPEGRRVGVCLYVHRHIDVYISIHVYI